ncbi:4'-phosphopantetheinyl transferase family protein [Mucilaginibacter ginsenosidivorans]|uniref:4'-phosphopantetheinyl transferase superfamily protein n=1 Tax=Mucilaginibacter ginsenosidivorans TaxID=398053 RepID=A0A5B8V0B6_9SPHI|nr:4'-phosphopantetheinyl transferase superfamily protein [Mucilaginibacter ginsenosidivorans]QEC64947.1 4'-phosphopantetheinyl transferase superfamily protein [Mucilaginibacter ginsenosidivorans]
MLTCCYAHIDRQWSEQELAEKLLLLPQNMRAEASKKRVWTDKQLYIAGKLLLAKLLQQFDIHFSLGDVKYSSYHRPYFDHGIDFNIAHSGNFAICCGTATGKVGVDIEQIKPTDLSEYTDYFTYAEREVIRSYPDIMRGFYDFWTRKEALLKAVGTGFNIPFSSVDVTGDVVEYANMTYHIQKLNIDTGYPCHIATTSPSSVILLAVNL